VTQAVILAGGKGTRLAERLGGSLPKPLVDVDGEPLLGRVMRHLMGHGVDDFLLLVNHGAEHIARFVARPEYHGVRVRLVDDGEPRGTAGAVLGAFDDLDDRFIVIYGDTLLNVDITALMAAHEAAHADATLFLHPNDHPHDSDIVETGDDGRVLRFHPYPHAPGTELPNLVNAALYVVEKRALTPYRGISVPSDFGRNLFPQMLEDGASLRGYASFEYIKDIGTPKRLEKAERALRSGVVARASLSMPQKAVFVDRDGTLNEHRGFLREPGELHLLPGVAEGIARLNENEFRVIVVTNQPVIARGETTFEGLRQIHNRLETLLGEKGAFVDAIYFCPHHPDRGFAGEVPELKIDCDCRKPATGMITRAARALHVDLARSWMIGDTPRDMETARRAGLRAILVRTGEQGRDGDFDVTPEFTCDSFSDAVRIVLTSPEGHA
jgi:histidinol-phosphate phosphatase family protein